MLTLGQVLRDRYRIDALPDGATPAYRAFDTAENRVCAVKEFEGEQAALLEREAEALAARRHPNLPQLYDHFKLDTILYAVFEWPDGESLLARVKRDGKLAESDATRWVGQVLATLDYIHALNLPIARGGFSPAHLWIAENQITLYGGLCALVAQSPAELAPYIAPEGGNEKRADVFSAGATLYTLLTARVPEHASPRKHNPAITHATANIIRRALSHRPEARFATIREMRKTLGRAKARTEKVEIVLGTQPPPFPTAPVVGGGLVILFLLIGGFFLVRGSLVAAPRAVPATQNRVDATATPNPSPTATPPPTLAAAPTATREATATLTATPNLIPPAGGTATSPRDQMILVFVPEGPFVMGSPNTDPLAFGNEMPDHTVDVPSFWIDRTEVTNAQYQLCAADKQCTLPGVLDSVSRAGYYDDPAYADYPVIWVNWEQATTYCAWAGRRLPAEAEWEKAARGTDARLYPWGNQPPDNTLLNYDLAAGDTTKVGSFPNGASPYGMLDASGNVVEWVGGFYYDSYFVAVANPVTPTASFRGGVRPLRSSSWNDLFANIRVASRRFSSSQAASFNDVGFRCASGEKP